jgi:hypothetical protein
MVEKGRLLYEEEFRETRIQAEIGGNHIGILSSILLLILTWTLFGYYLWKGVSAFWTGAGLFFAIVLTIISLYLIDKFIGMEFTQNLPIKIYDKGILMPTTPYERIMRGKQSFIHDNDLESVTLVRSHKPNQMDKLIAKTKGKKIYIKRYDRTSDVPEDILENVHISAPQAKISISE